MSIRRPPIPPSIARPPLASIPVVAVPPPPSDAEWQAIADRHKAAKYRLDKFIEDEGKCLWKERSYPVDIILPLFSGNPVGTDGYPVSIGVINVDLGSTFYVLGIESSYTVTGTLLEDGVGDAGGAVVSPGSKATLTLPETIRPFVFDYTWTIRDSATDRDWCNVPIPSGVIRTGNLGYFNAGGQARVAGGTKITVTINPTLFNNNSATANVCGLDQLDSHSLQLVLTGIEVKDGVM